MFAVLKSNFDYISLRLDVHQMTMATLVTSPQFSGLGCCSQLSFSFRKEPLAIQ